MQTTNDCKHTKLRCKKCMRDGDLEFFITDSPKTEGWIEFDHNTNIDPNEWERLTDIIHDWIHMSIDPSEKIEIDFTVNMFYRLAKDANDVTENYKNSEPCMCNHPRGCIFSMMVGTEAEQGLIHVCNICSEIVPEPTPAEAPDDKV